MLERWELLACTQTERVFLARVVSQLFGPNATKQCSCVLEGKTAAAGGGIPWQYLRRISAS